LILLRIVKPNLVRYANSEHFTAQRFGHIDVVEHGIDVEVRLPIGDKNDDTFYVRSPTRQQLLIGQPEGARKIRLTSCNIQVLYGVDEIWCISVTIKTEIEDCSGTEPDQTNPRKRWVDRERVDDLLNKVKHIVPVLHAASC
jgi:hypothetical protein